MEEIRMLNDLIRSKYFTTYEDSWFSNLIHSPDNNGMIKRITEAAEFGGEGRTHSEVLQLWQDATNDAYSDDIISNDIKESIIKEICDCIFWHCKNESLHNEIG